MSILRFCLILWMIAFSAGHALYARNKIDLIDSQNSDAYNFFVEFDAKSKSKLDDLYLQAAMSLCGQIGMTTDSNRFKFEKLKGKKQKLTRLTCLEKSAVREISDATQLIGDSKGEPCPTSLFSSMKRGVESILRPVMALLRPKMPTQSEPEPLSTGIEDGPKIALDQFSKEFIDEKLDEAATLNKRRVILEGGVEELTLPETDNERATVIRYHNATSTDNPKTQNFVDRLNMASIAALLWAKKEAKNAGPEELKKFERQVKAFAEKYHAEILKHPLDQKILESEAERGSLKHFKEIYKTQKKILKGFVVEIQKLAQEAGFIEKGKKPSFKEYEDEYISAQNRPNIVSIYKVNSEQVGLIPGGNPHTFISGHRPLKKLGAVQNSGTRKNPGLPNALETSFSKLNPDGSVNTLLSAYRHGVYAPYKVKDPAQRMKMAADNMRELLSHIVEKHKDAHGNQCPAEIPLSTTMLLTPFLGDTLFRGRKGEAESVHLEESYLTTRLFANRKITVAGCEIIPRTTAMNFGSHTWGRLDPSWLLQSRGAHPTFQDGVNAKGFYDFETSVANFTQGMSDRLLKRDDANLTSLGQQLKSLTVFFSARQTPENSQRKKEADEIESKLRQLYSTFEKHLDLENTKEAAQIRSEILKQEKIYQAKFKEIQKNNQTDFDKNESSLKAQTNAALQSLNRAISNAQNDPTLLADLTRQRDLLDVFQDTKELYFNNANDKREYRHHVQANLVIANHLLGKSVEFFCKSAEDRTGRVDNKVQETLIYRETHGRFPRYQDASAQKAVNRIAQKVLNGSASVQTTDMNNPGAGGMQLHSDPAYGVRSEMGLLMGNLAKSFYRAGSKLYVAKKGSPAEQNRRASVTVVRTEEEDEDDDLSSNNMNEYSREYADDKDDDLSLTQYRENVYQEWQN